MSRRRGGLLAAIAALMQPERPSLDHAEIVTATVDCLSKCGLDPHSFEVHSLGSESRASPMLLVTISKEIPMFWEYVQHVEAYVVDRLHRKFDLLIGRIVFIRPLRDSMDMREARRGVRAIYSQLRGAPGAVTFSAVAGGPSRNHHVDESALSSAHGVGESIVAGLDIVAAPQVNFKSAKTQ